MTLKLNSPKAGDPTCAFSSSQVIDIDRVPKPTVRVTFALLSKVHTSGAQFGLFQVNRLLTNLIPSNCIDAFLLY